jgi:VanZ family protein
VSRIRSFIRYWVPVLLCMGLVFLASSDQGSFPRSSHVIAPVVRWLFPEASEETIHAVIVFVRKCAHLTEYAVLALLLWRALHKPRKNDVRPWQWSHAGVALVVTTLYAASDEFHQLFVPSREASVWDVLLDTAGGAVALLCVWAVGRLRGRGR